jgi:hypothetical protein
LFQERIQFDENLAPVWIHFKSHGEQVTRFKRDDPVTIRFLSRGGQVLPFFNEADPQLAPNPFKQTLLTLNITPYARDASFTNHSTEPISPS